MWPTCAHQVSAFRLRHWNPRSSVPQLCLQASVWPPNAADPVPSTGGAHLALTKSWMKYQLKLYLCLLSYTSRSIRPNRPPLTVSRHQQRDTPTQISWWPRYCSRNNLRMLKYKAQAMFLFSSAYFLSRLGILLIPLFFFPVGSDAVRLCQKHIFSDLHSFLPCKWSAARLCFRSWVAASGWPRTTWALAGHTPNWWP